MTTLIFVGRSDDNTHLVFADDNGNEYLAPIDDHLLRNISVPLASVTPVLGVSPRDIQMRIRRGESILDIADESGETVERIERYAGPVLAERWHMSQRARETSVRRPYGDAPLSDIVKSVLSELGVDVLALEWDSYRRDDARWNVSVTWPSGDGSGAATWIYDPMGHTIVALDDEARWIFDEGAAPAQSAMPATSESRPRLVSLPTHDEPVQPPVPTHTESGRHVAAVSTPAFDPDMDVSQDTSDDALDLPSWAGPGHPTIPVSVMDDEPSWDDILFGSRPSDS